LFEDGFGPWQSVYILIFNVVVFFSSMNFGFRFVSPVKRFIKVHQTRSFYLLSANTNGAWDAPCANSNDRPNKK
jgi:hypothetical protein